MAYFIMLAGVLWLISGILMTYQSRLYQKQCRQFEELGELVVGHSGSGFFSGKISVFLAVDKKGVVLDAAKMDNTAFLHKPRLSPLALIIGKRLGTDKFENSLLDANVKRALNLAASSYVQEKGRGKRK